MKIKRFFAPDIRRAIRMVRDELGAEAVILSNRNIDGGTEIVAARDFDEELLQGNLNRTGKSSDRSENALSRVDKTTESNRDDAKPRDLRGHLSETVGRRQSHTAQHTDLEPAKTQSSASTRLVKPKPKTDKPAVVVRESTQPTSGEPLLSELRTEFREMRKLLDTRLGEVAWTDSLRGNPTHIAVLRRLSELGFSKSLSKTIVGQVDGQDDIDRAWRQVIQFVSDQLPISEDNLLDYGGIVALVGPTGVGKTTTIAKLAAKYRIKHGARQVALVTTDNYRIAAHDQLNTYGRILDIPVRVAQDSNDLKRILNRFIDKRLILIDTAGMSQRDMRLAEQFSVFRNSDLPIKAYLVMSAATQLRTMHEIIEAFRAFQPHAGILTKLDETVSNGAAISAIIEQQLPLSFVSDGQRVPENLHVPRSQEMVKQCLESEFDCENTIESVRNDYHEGFLHAFG